VPDGIYLVVAMWLARLIIGFEDKIWLA